jgi:hypothetical protein
VQMLQPPPGLQPLTPSCELPERGAGCYVAGHALFNPISRFAPLLTHGNVAQVPIQLDMLTTQPPTNPTTAIE